MIECKKLDGEISLYTVSNGTISFSAMDFGCTITNLFVNDKNGHKVDILLGYDTLSEWKRGMQAHNAIVGRVANRIRGGEFTLDGKKYLLEKNDGQNCLHGGDTRYEKMLWKGEEYSDSEGIGVKFTRKSPDGEQGFPGNLDLCVIYKISEKNELIFEYTGTTDGATPINLTNHAYFNLNGTGSVLNHRLQLDCCKVLESASDSAPSGKIFDVEGTPFDFRTEKKVGAEIEKLAVNGKDKPFGYDHCFVTSADETHLARVGILSSDESGISMEIFTNQRGVHVYTANYLGGKGKGGVNQKMHDGICFETERFPNAINEPSFPSCVLRPSEKYWHKTVFKLKTSQ
ncbi:aldose epimerase family protein [uncultured Treponema sp.]|uniref:aldose epimerase family protein n=1 Tax=uncultured Treponema sp. TaxID=162155 RepID=UPI0025CC3A78|nr:aldose epimerase family protein [uncultured Treponema sp.]